MAELFSEQLRRAIRESGITRYSISAKTGVDQAALSKFLKGERGLSLSAVDRVMSVLGLEIKRKG